MRYPSLIRTILCTVPLTAFPGGRSQALLFSVFDRLFEERDFNQTVRVDGVRLKVNLQHPGERLLYYAPCNMLLVFRRSDLYLLMRRLHNPAGGVFVDIGANLGMYSLLARQLGLDTILFEPEPRHYDFLLRNNHAFGRVVGCALSDSVGISKFYVGGEQNPGGSSLVAPSEYYNAYEGLTVVKVSTFDAILGDLGIDPSSLRMIKVDVEGNERRTLRGMSGYLSHPEAAPVWCEVRASGSGRGNNYIAIMRYMAEFGYHAYRTEGQVVYAFRPTSPLPGTVFDLLFLVPERHGYLINAVAPMT